MDYDQYLKDIYAPHLPLTLRQHVRVNANSSPGNLFPYIANFEQELMLVPGVGQMRSELYASLLGNSHIMRVMIPVKHGVPAGDVLFSPDFPEYYELCRRAYNNLNKIYKYPETEPFSAKVLQNVRIWWLENDGKQTCPPYSV